jgi:hypothetical protein
VSAPDLFDLASAFLMRLNDHDGARSFLAAYDMRVQFDVTDGEPFYAVIRGGAVADVRRGRVDAFSNRDDFEVFGPEDGMRLVFEGRLTPAVAMYYGKLTPRGERAKHNQAAVVFTLLHQAQQPAYLVRPDLASDLGL